MLKHESLVKFEAFFWRHNCAVSLEVLWSFRFARRTNLGWLNDTLSVHMHQLCHTILQHAGDLTTALVITQHLMVYSRRSRPSCKSKTHCCFPLVTHVALDRLNTEKWNWRNALWEDLVIFSELVYMLVQWNVIVYANIMLPMTLVSDKLNVPFFSTLLQWDKNCNCF